MKTTTRLAYNRIIGVIAFMTLLGWQGLAPAQTTLAVTPITWNVIGLDSNNVNVGPNHFPIGARVCNTGSEAADGVQGTFVWESANPYIDLRPGTNTTVTWASIPVAGAGESGCRDFYFEVEVDRNPAAYTTRRLYRIDVTATNVSGTLSTPAPRELYVERLISQSRNAVSDMQVDDGTGFKSVVAGQGMTLLVGNTYQIKLVASTATQGYEQIESFINFPNTIFQVISASTTYSADSSSTENPPFTKLYGNGCVWENNPFSLNYRSCLGVGKLGGNVTVTYTVKIMSVPGAPLVNPEPLSTLIYDFSGSSFHYNADFSATVRYATIASPATLSKSFTPKLLAAGGNSTLTFTISNASSQAIAGMSFLDDTTGSPSWPSGLNVVNTTVTYGGSSGATSCGTPTPTLAAGQPGASFSNISVAANSNCTISITVSAASDGVYRNGTKNLFIGTSDTGSFGTDTLLVSSKPPLSGYDCGASTVTMAAWSFGTTAFSLTPSITPATGTTIGFATASSTGGTFAGNTGDGNPASSWSGSGWATSGTATVPYPPSPLLYYQFDIDTQDYSKVSVTFDYRGPTNDWGNDSNNFFYVYSDFNTTGSPSFASGSGQSFNFTKSNNWNSGGAPLTHVAVTTGSSRTRFFVNAAGAKSGGISLIDNVTIKGCARPLPPTLRKDFLSATIGTGATSQLRFEIANPNAGPLTGVTFVDALPAGLVVASPPGVSAISCLSGTLSGSITANAGSGIISFTGGSLSGGATQCRFTVNVLGTKAGNYANATTAVRADYTSANGGGPQVGFGSSSLTVVDPPALSKAFGSSSVITGSTSNLTFSVTNPNTATNMTNVAFTDTLPSGITVTNDSKSACGGGTLTQTSPNTISLSGGVLNAGATCTFSVTVTGAVAGSYTNTTGSVSATASGVTVTGNTASASILVKNLTPGISLLKQVGLSATGPWASFLPTTGGTNLYYQFVIENTGDADLSGLSFSDNTLNTSSCSWPTSLPTSNPVATCVVGAVTAGTNTSVTNVASTSGSYLGSTVTSTDSAMYTTGAATLALTKLAKEESFSAAGATINYVYAVTNTGGAALAGNVTITDDKTTVSCPAGGLAPGATIICSAVYTTTATDVTNGKVTNKATATSNGVTSNEATATVPYSGVVDFGVTITDGTTTLVSGGSTTFTVTVQNNGPDVTNATLIVPVVSGLSKTAVLTCTAYGGATCPSNLTIANLEAGTVAIPSMPSGSSFSFGFTASVTATNPDVPVVQTATVTAVGKTDSVSSNNSSSDSGSLAQNFGHLPSNYANMNLKADGGARHLTGSTYLGASVTTANDGINTASYTPKASDDGITWTGTNWTEGCASCGSVSVNATCPGGGCWVYGWVDWNKDGDFSDPGEQIVGQAVSNGSNSITFAIPTAGDITLDGSTMYSRFRIYSAQPGTGSPSGLAVNSSGTALIGEIEDPILQIKEGGTPTPVTLAFFQAQRRGGAVWFNWSTATETGNIGFNLYVTGNGKTALINSELISSRVVDSLNRNDYSFVADVDGDTFFIEDVSVIGITRRHGPFKIDQEYGALVAEEKIDREAIRAELAAKLAEQQLALRKEIKIPPAAYENRFSESPSFLLTTTLNLEVRNTGIHRVTYEALKAAGLDLAGVPTPKIALLNQGKEVPIYVSGGQGSGGKFGPGGFIEFHGVALDTIYTDTNIYTLQVNTSASSQILSISAGPPMGLLPPETFVGSVTINRQKVYGGTYAPGDDAWYDTSMLVYKVQKAWEFPFDVDSPASTSDPATIEVVLWGVTDFPGIDPDHHTVVSVNGVRVADAFFNGLVEKRLTATLPAGSLLKSGNTLRITMPGDTAANWDMVNFDRIHVTYPRTFAAKDGRLEFTADGRVFRVTNLPSSNVVVYRLGEDRPVRMDRVKVEASGAGYAATFAGSNDRATYLVSTVPALYSPVLRAARVVANLDREADYLVISHPGFISDIQPLVNARRAQGLSVSVVDVFDIYAQYSYGIFDPAAIRSYINFAASKLGVRHVLLVGGDTYDYRNYLGGGGLSFIPSLYVSTGLNTKAVPVDPLFGDVDGDNVPDVAVGRFPARTSGELSILLNKTFAYSAKSYERTAVFASDKFDGIVSFKAITNSMIATLSPDWSVQRVHLDDMSVTSARSSLINSMNSGVALVNFTGHSGPSYWTFSSLFTTAHAAALTNAGRPFVAVQWGCWNTYHVDPLNNYLVQSFLFSGDRGAAAVLGASTLTGSSSEEKLGRLLIPRLTRPGTTVGEALLDAKKELAKTDPDLLDVLLGWTLMGDPALVMQP